MTKTKRMQVIAKDNTEKGKVTKAVRWDDDYYCVYSFRRVPVSSAFKEELAGRLIKWVNDPEQQPFKISEFLIMVGLPERTYYRWLPTCEALNEAHLYATAKLGNLREKSAAMHGYDPGMIKPTLGHYCKIWAEQQERVAQLNKKDEDTKKGNITILMEDFNKKE